MPIACTRCGNSEDGEILTAPIAFAFKHALGCGHGVGPLAVIKGKTPKKTEKKTKKVKVVEKSVETNTEDSFSNTTATASETLEVATSEERTE